MTDEIPAMPKQYRDPGGAWWAVDCPACHQPQTLYAAVGVKLTVPSDAAAKLQLTCKALAVEHACAQLGLDLVTGELRAIGHVSSSD